MQIPCMPPSCRPAPRPPEAPAAACWAIGERQLLNDAVTVPLFAQQKRLLIAPGIQNLIFDPFGPVLDLTYTTKE